MLKSLMDNLQCDAICGSVTAELLFQSSNRIVKNTCFAS